MYYQKKDKVLRFLGKKLIVIFFLANATCYAQNSIYFDDPNKFPSELANLKTWLINVTNEIPFRLGSFKVSLNLDAALNIYTLRTNQPRFAKSPDFEE